MIIVTVEVPMMGVSYDFQIDEDAPLGIVRSEIADMIIRNSQCVLNGSVGSLVMWDKKRNIILDMRRTGYENGLETGSELVIA